MATMLNAGAGARGVSTITTRAILDSIGTRLDEGRELNRYLVGLLVFLGLLGTFWGLLETVHSISGVIDSMKTGVDTTTMFDDLKSGLSAPIAGMSVSFTSSLFGLAEFADPRLPRPSGGAGAEPVLHRTRGLPRQPRRDDAARRARCRKGRSCRRARNQRSKQRDAAIATLAEGIQSLVGHMRTEQQQIRDWVDAQAVLQDDIRKLLRRLLDERERVSSLPSPTGRGAGGEGSRREDPHPALRAPSP